MIRVGWEMLDEAIKVDQRHYKYDFGYKYKMTDFNARDKKKHERILEKVGNVFRLHFRNRQTKTMGSAMFQ